jgi:hypothetical protein
MGIGGGGEELASCFFRRAFRSLCFRSIPSKFIISSNGCLLSLLYSDSNDSETSDDSLHDLTTVHAP